MVSAAHDFNIQDFDMTGMIVLGQEQDDFGGGFVQEEMFFGSLSQMNIWSRALSHREIRDLVSCKMELHGDIFSTDIDSMENYNVTESFSFLKDLCNDDQNFVIFPDVLDFADAMDFCGKTGGPVYTPRSCKESSESFYNQTLQFIDHCPDSFWIGVTDIVEEGIWRQAGSERLATTSFGFPPNGKESENCASIRMETKLWDDRSCHHPHRCFTCLALPQRPLVFRGLCFKIPERTYFEVLGYKNDKPYFHGYYGYVIYLAEGKWLLKDVAENVILASGLPSTGYKYPIGRHRWMTHTKVCGFRKDEDIELSMSTCNSSEIVCSDGHCVAVVARCDGRYQCPDHSDENSCKIIHFPEGYRRQLAPEPKDPSIPDRINMTIAFLR